MIVMEKKHFALWTIRKPWLKLPAILTIIYLVYSASLTHIRIGTTCIIVIESKNTSILN